MPRQYVVLAVLTALLALCVTAGCQETSKEGEVPKSATTPEVSPEIAAAVSAEDLSEAVLEATGTSFAIPKTRAIGTLRPTPPAIALYIATSKPERQCQIYLKGAIR